MDNNDLRPSAQSGDVSYVLLAHGARNRRLIYLGRLIRSFNTAFLTIVFPLYLSSMGYSPARIGLVLTLGGLLSAGSVAIIWRVSLKYDARIALVLVATLAVGTSAALILTSSVWVVVIANGMGGIGRGGGAGSGGGWGPVFAAEQPLLASFSGQRSRNRSFANLNLIGALGAALGSTVTWVPTALHSDGHSWEFSYRSVFLVAALLGLGCVAAAWRIGTPETAVVPPSSGARRRGEFGVPRGWLVRRVALLNLLNGFGGGFTGPLLVYWFYVKFGVGVGELGTLFLVVNGLSVVGFALSAGLASRLGDIYAVVVTRIASLVCVAGMLIPSGVGMAGLAFALSQLFNSLGMPVRQSYPMRIAHDTDRDSIAAAGSFTDQVALSASPVLGGVLMERVVDIPIVGWLAATLANTVAYYIAFRRRPEGGRGR